MIFILNLKKKSLIIFNKKQFSQDSLLMDLNAYLSKDKNFVYQFMTLT